MQTIRRKRERLAFYNATRLHSTLGYVSPMNYEKNWLAAQVRKSAYRSQLRDTSNEGKVITFVPLTAGEIGVNVLISHLQTTLRTLI